MTLSTPGLIGAAAGLVCALVAYVVMSAELKRRETAANASAVDGKPDPSVSIIRAILLADFVVLAAVGYYVGQLLG